MPPPSLGCQPALFGGTLEITHLQEGHSRCIKLRAWARGNISSLCPEQQEEGRALQKSGLQREMGEVCLNMYILLWQPRQDAM